ncbi:HlyD family efflux transporter periplasmic adaptor subunit [Bacillus sp. S3]|uniref:efflux RND transporter periplasmic adaptor subunit n=1 Tax=Bacillus sp. S3 TaxID=486398 RepID=UPI0011896A61|nr:HlyD family efflux transporter periplasmic adaptor subunit [Bacillus sp. S3]QCJ41044.1 HlyD family efflux transporter periplasmic adaptor subunit [Bacillus sp. S3]
MKKWIWILISVLVIGFVGYQWYHSKNSTSGAAVQVRTAAVQKGKLEVKISASGTVEPVTSVDIKAAADNPEIDEVLVAAGDKVNEGDELVTFTDDSDPITAPAAGTITTVSVNEGERVTNGTVVAHLTNYDDLQTVVQVDELDIPKVKNEQVVDLTVSAYPDAAYTGKVTNIAAEGNSQNGTTTFDVTVHIDQPTNLKVGMSNEASILTVSKEDALYVPIDAVHTNNGEKYVIVTSATSGTEEDGVTTEQKTVKTGIATDEYVEITEGVTVGDTVQLPQLSSGNSTSNQKSRMMQGLGGMNGGGFGGMPPSGGGQGAPGGRSGN